MHGRKFSRTKSHRRALFANLTNSLIEHEQIKTTLPKAKDLRAYAEKLITVAKNDTLHNRRLVLAKLRNKAAVKKLFEVLGKRYDKRPGGYTRVLKAGFRYGDAAPMAFIELVDRDLNAKGLKDREFLAAQAENEKEKEADAAEGAGKKAAEKTSKKPSENKQKKKSEASEADKQEKKSPKSKS
jgi:large subunit ribosomal protein L17